MTQLLLVHGAFHGVWCWDRLLPELGSRGVSADTVDLPFTTAAHDVATVQTAIDRLAASGDPVVVLGHSFGGAVISAAVGSTDADPSADLAGSVAHLVYLTAIMLGPGEPVDLGDTDGMHGIRFEAETTSIDPEQAVAALYHRCDPQDAAWAVGQLRSMPTKVFTTPACDPPAWKAIPSTYIVCTDDRTISPSGQRAMAAHATSSVEIDSDHSPFLACPGRLAEVLAGIVDGT